MEASLEQQNDCQVQKVLKKVHSKSLFQFISLIVEKSFIFCHILLGDAETNCYLINLKQFKFVRAILGPIQAMGSICVPIGLYRPPYLTFVFKMIN